MGFKNKSTVIYQVWALDVWGPEDDWTVSDRRRVGVVSVRTDRHSKSGEWHASNSAITRALVENDYLTPDVTSRDLNIDGEDDGVLFVESTGLGEPLFQLEYTRHHQEPQKSTGLFGLNGSSNSSSSANAPTPSSEDYAQNPSSFWTPTTIGLTGLGVITLAAIGYGVWKGYQAKQQQQAQLPQTQTPSLGGGSGDMTSQDIADQQDQVPPFVPGT